MALIAAEDRWETSAIAPPSDHNLFPSVSERRTNIFSFLLCPCFASPCGDGYSSAPAGFSFTIAPTGAAHIHPSRFVYTEPNCISAVIFLFLLRCRQLFSSESSVWLLTDSHDSTVRTFRLLVAAFRARVSVLSVSAHTQTRFI